MTTIQVRRGTAAQWTAAATVLAAGELGLDTTNNILKLGDGSTAWASLSSVLNGSKATEGMTLTSYGDSYVTGQGSSASGGGGSFANRVARRLGCYVHNWRGVGGQQLSDTLKTALAASPWTNDAGQIALVHVGLNNVRYGDGSGTTALADWNLGLPVLLDLLTCGTRYEQNHASFTLSGSGWGAHTDVSDVNASGGTYSYTTTQNDYYEWTVPAGVTAVSFVTPGGFADIAWKKNGVAAGTSTKAATASVVSGTQTWTHFVKQFTGLTTGDVIRATNGASSILFADVALVPSATPPPIYLLTPGYLASYATSPSSGSDGGIDAQVAATTTIAAAYPTVRVLNANLLGWNKATMIATDTVHPNDLGHSFLADIVTARIQADLTLTTTGFH